MFLIWYVVPGGHRLSAYNAHGSSLFTQPSPLSHSDVAAMYSKLASESLLPLSLNSRAGDINGTMWGLYANYGQSQALPCLPLAYIFTIARECLLSAMRSGVKTGSLVIVEGDNVYTFGEPSPPKQSAIVLRVLSANFWCRVYTSHDLGCKSCHDYTPFPC